MMDGRLVRTGLPLPGGGFPSSCMMLTKPEASAHSTASPSFGDQNLVLSPGIGNNPEAPKQRKAKEAGRWVEA